MKVKWIYTYYTAYPQCSRCGSYPLLGAGRDEYDNYLLQCPNCGKVTAVKTDLQTLVSRAKRRCKR